MLPLSFGDNVMKLRTVTIDNNGSPLVINETDFRRGSDELWMGDMHDMSASVVDVRPENGADSEPEEVENNVVVQHKGGGRWTVTVNDQPVHEGTLAKAEAQALADEY